MVQVHLWFAAHANLLGIRPAWLRVKGCFTKIKVEANKWKRVGMVAGGSGLTPCLQVAEELLSLPDDKTKIDLIFCNKNEGDIFLNSESIRQMTLGPPSAPRC